MSERTAPGASTAVSQVQPEASSGPNAPVMLWGFGLAAAALVAWGAAEVPRANTATTQAVGAFAVFGGLAVGLLVTFLTYLDVGVPLRGRDFVRAMVRRYWRWLAWAVAFAVPTVVFADWNSRPGALQTGQYAGEWALGATAYVGMRLLGWAFVHPKAAVKVIAYLGCAALVCVLAVYAFEALTVKALLFIIVVMLIGQAARR